MKYPFCKSNKKITEHNSWEHTYKLKHDLDTVELENETVDQLGLSLNKFKSKFLVSIGTKKVLNFSFRTNLKLIKNWTKKQKQISKMPILNFTFKLVLEMK